MSAHLPWSRGKSHQSESEFHGDENEVHATTGPNGLATLADPNNATVEYVRLYFNMPSTNANVRLLV
jgi:hypothetical protein